MNGYVPQKEISEEEAMMILKQLMSLTISEPDFLKLSAVSESTRKSSQGDELNKGEDVEMGDASDSSTTADLTVLEKEQNLRVILGIDKGKQEEYKACVDSPKLETEEEKEKLFQKRCIDILMRNDKLAQRSLLQQYIAFLKARQSVQLTMDLNN